MTTLPTFVAAAAVIVATHGAADAVPLPAGWAAGDLHIAITVSSGTPAIPTGFTSLQSVTAGTNRFTISYRIAQAGDSHTINTGGAGTGGQVIGFRGVDTTNPFNVNVTDSETTSDTSVSIAGLTTTINNCLVVDFASVVATRTISAWANASLANLIERVDGTLSDSATTHSVFVNTGEKATAGAVSATTATLSSSNSNKALHKVAIAPTPDAASGKFFQFFN